MKKLPLAILVLVVIALFITADYVFNLPGGLPKPKPSLPSQTEDQTAEVGTAAELPNVTKQVLEDTGSQSYKLEKRSRSTQLFESFNLSEVANIVAFRNILVSQAQGQTPIYAYEIHAPAGQGAISYLNIKLAILDQLRGEAGINETGGVGYSSLFYNDPQRPETAFLLSQVGDIVFGFQYDKNSATAFDFVKNLVNNYMSSIEQ